RPALGHHLQTSEHIEPEHEANLSYRISTPISRTFTGVDQSWAVPLPGSRMLLPDHRGTEAPDTDHRRTIVTASSTSIRRSAILTALLASLALAPQALASTTVPPDRADGLGGANATSHIAPVLPPDRADGLGGASAAQHTIVQLS